MAAGRSALRNEAWMIASAPGVSSAAATPWIIRKTDQLQRRLGEGAQGAAQREAGDADQVDPSTPQPVAQRPADQDEGGQASAR